jgi:hypothetical protein
VYWPPVLRPPAKTALCSAANRFDEKHIQSVANDVKKLIEDRGHPVRRVDIPPPGKHPHASIMGLLLLAAPARQRRMRLAIVELGGNCHRIRARHGRPDQEWRRDVGHIDEIVMQRRYHPVGAARQLRKGLRKLAAYLPHCEGIDTARLHGDGAHGNIAAVDVGDERGRAQQQQHGEMRGPARAAQTHSVRSGSGVP